MPATGSADTLRAALVGQLRPVGTPGDQLPNGRVIEKRHTRVTISWA